MKSFQERICVSVCDSEYSHPSCLIEARKNPNQIHISRARNNRIFYRLQKNYSGIGTPAKPPKKTRHKSLVRKREEAQP